MYEFLVGIPPFNDDTIDKIFDNIVNLKMEWPQIGNNYFFFKFFFAIHNIKNFDFFLN